MTRDGNAEISSSCKVVRHSGGPKNPGWLARSRGDDQIKGIATYMCGKIHMLTKIKRSQYF